MDVQRKAQNKERVLERVATQTMERLREGSSEESQERLEDAFERLGRGEILEK